MIESLKYVATFHSTGRTLKNHIKFKPGLTVIVGENEAGKSFVFEMIRYALFGSDALRGLRSDYDKLDVTLKITIKDKLYTIIREGNRATININEAVGTTAVNNYIKRLLGLSLEVFDISANAKQGELDRLTKDMGATERRKIIDEVTGLNLFEAAERECREEANGFRKVADALEAQLVEPIAPARPDDYEDSQFLKLRLDEEIKNKTLRDNFKLMDVPTRPQKPNGSIDAIEYEQNRAIVEAQRQALQQQLDKLPEVDDEYDKETLERFKAAIKQTELGPMPLGYSEADLLQWRTDWHIINNESDPIRCGNCGEIVSGKEPPSAPELSLSEIDEQLKRIRAWEGIDFDSSLGESPLGKEEIEKRLRAIDSDGERQFIINQYNALGVPSISRADEANEWLNYNKALEYYERQEQQYAEWLIEKEKIEKLPQPEPFLSEKYEMALRYETLQAKYDTQLEIYQQQQQQLDKNREKASGFKRGSDALKEARKDVKRYLVPSLSKVSSQLLQEMTDGQRREIKIDEDFEIWVDKQHVRTLSGSGVSVVNLALRIALGQVLTQSILPFFLADEIDADMAAKRTKATHDSLKRLKSKLKQIIVITHKDFEGDHKICLS